MEDRRGLVILFLAVVHQRRPMIFQHRVYIVDFNQGNRTENIKDEKLNLRIVTWNITLLDDEHLTRPERRTAALKI